MAFVDGPVRVRVPATSANLGPGFDALGLALGLHDVVEAHVVPDGGVHIEVSGEGAGELSTDESHLVASSALWAFDLLGDRPKGLVIRCENRIPQARGLGSSSAAVVAGIMLARALTVDGPDRLPIADVLRLADEIEGHPDNVAPCLLGGFTIAWSGPDGARAVRLEPTSAVQPMIFVPDERGLTAHARAALPPHVPHTDAARNAGRAALLVYALTQAPDLLFEATEDRLHQDYRAPGMPGTAALVTALRAARVAAVVSGAGPSVLAFVGTGQHVRDQPGWRTLSPGCDMTGAAATLGG
jgi:homoserine kinase